MADLTDDQKAQVVTAVAEFLADAEKMGRDADGKPNVADVKALVGFDLSAADRDVAYEVVIAAKAEDPAEEPPQGDAPLGSGNAPDSGPVGGAGEAPKGTDSSVDGEDSAKSVTNNHTGRLGVRAVGGRVQEVESKQTVEFEIDMSHGTNKIWVERGVLTVA